MKMTKTAWILIFVIFAVLVATAVFTPRSKPTPIRVGSAVQKAQKTNHNPNEYSAKKNFVKIPLNKSLSEPEILSLQNNQKEIVIFRERCSKIKDTVDHDICIAGLIDKYPALRKTINISDM